MVTKKWQGPTLDLLLKEESVKRELAVMFIVLHKHRSIEVQSNPALRTPVYNGQFRLTRRKKKLV